MTCEYLNLKEGRCTYTHDNDTNNEINRALIYKSVFDYCNIQFTNSNNNDCNTDMESDVLLKKSSNNNGIKKLPLEKD